MNAIFLGWLKEMRDEEEPDSNKYMILNKAFNSLKKESREFSDPDSLIVVKFIGPKIVSDLRKRWKSGGRAATMGEIPSNLPSPPKRKRASGASASEPKKRGRLPKQALFEPESDDEDALPVPKRRAAPIRGGEGQSSNFHVDEPLAFAPPQYPLGVRPQAYQPYPANPRPALHDVIANDLHVHYGYTPHVYQQALGPGPSNLAPPALPQSLQSFNFSYIDGDGKQVLSSVRATVDIEAGSMWYKMGFLDCSKSKRHPLRQRVRLDSYENRGRKRGGDLVIAWISDEDVEQFGLHEAPGLQILEDTMDVDGIVGVIESNSQAMSHSQSQDTDRGVVKSKTVETSTKSQDDSLEDLLKAESKKRRNTIDPSRILDLEKQWDIRMGTATGSNNAVIKNEDMRSQQDIRPQEAMRQRIAVAAMTRNKSSSSIPAPSLVSSPQSQSPASSIANSVLHNDSSLREYPRNSNRIRQGPPKHFDLPVQTDPSPSYGTASAQHVHPLVHERLGTVTAPAILPSAAATPTLRAMPKGKVRGRVSEFAPPLPAVDELDVDLDRQASQRMQAEKIASTSTSSVSADFIDDVTDLTAITVQSFDAFRPIIFPRGSFDIVLVLDNREVKSNKNRDYIAEELRKKGVKVVQRSLALGDVLWIAQRRTPVTGAEGDECVLEYILERKRLDDLCLSIKDGRFREQKHRLANTGLRVFYLIEEYDLEKNRENFGVQIDTARSSTQIVDGFIVKETKKLCYTIDFLATMHRTIEEEYQHEPLYMIPSSLIKRHSYISLQKHLRNNQPTMRYLTSYVSFERLNSKSGNMTSRDLFAQMLLCIKGVSSEKASAIIKTYPTIRSLWSAFQIAEAKEREGKMLEEEEAEQGKKRKGKKKKVPQAQEMLCDPEAGGRQRIGPALSANIYRLLRANHYEE